MPRGTIYYITKGMPIGFGATAHVERLPSGHVIKSPKLNPYWPHAEEDHCRNMRTEAEVYRRIEGCPHFPKMIDWDSDSCCLTIEYLENGSLGDYMETASPVSLETQRRWGLHLATALKALHAANVIHCDLAPRNLLLDKSLHLYVADFAGSSVDGSTPSVAPGPRFHPPGAPYRAAKSSDDLFALGSVLYLIASGHEPYPDLEEEEIERLFGSGTFPDVSHLVLGALIRGCWEGTVGSAEEAMASLSVLHNGEHETTQLDHQGQNGG